ncbi:MAG: hypothetical protein RLZZ259_1168 [Pseudomonadota bacterium]
MGQRGEQALSLRPTFRNRIRGALQEVRNGRAVLYILLSLFGIVSAYVIASLFLGSQVFGKAVSSAGLLLGLCAFVQLRVCGFFESLLSILRPTDGRQRPVPRIADCEGQTISTGLGSKIRENLLTIPQIGFWMGFFALVIDVIAVWVPATI